MTDQIAWSIKSAALALDMPYAKVHEAVKSGRLFPDRVSGRAAERAAIAREAPLLNRQHNPARWRWVKATNSWQPAVYAAA